MEFANPYNLLWALCAVPYIVWYIFRRRVQDAPTMLSDTRAMARAPRTWKTLLVHVPFILRTAVIFLLAIVLARPQTKNSWKNRTSEGIDIMLCVDVSTSMLAQDLQPNRIEAAKSVAQEFINGRPDDNIGITVFSGEAFTQCPMTTDHAVLINLFQSVGCDMVTRGSLADGTAVGMGIANAVSRLKDSKAKSKVIILITDGTNNMGDISPLTAADIARNFGVRIYTIGVGTNGTAPYPYPVAGGYQIVQMPVEIDEKTLSGIAAQTGGEYYRATNNKKLEEVYREIDKLEKTKFNVKQYSRRYEAFAPFGVLAAILLLIEIILRASILKKFS